MPFHFCGQELAMITFGMLALPTIKSAVIGVWRDLVDWSR